MKIVLSKYAGFCFGVKRAMETAWKNISKESVYSLGDLIHNKQAIEKYKEKGLNVIENLEEIKNKENASIIIRSHGVSKKVYEDIKQKKFKIVDTTCPFVKKIQKIVNDYYKKGYTIIIVGDKNHPEIIGINGWCENSAFIIKNKKEATDLFLYDNDKKYCVVGQTTLNANIYEECSEILKEKVEQIEIFNTICSATRERQDDAKNISSRVDLMIVIGGFHSSNTQKLVQICLQNCKTFSVETLSDLKKYDSELLNSKSVGITAGASTPDWIIEEILDYLKKI